MRGKLIEQQKGIIVVEYETNPKEGKPIGHKSILPIPADDYERVLPRVGQEVEFVIWTGGRQVIGESEPDPVAWVQNTPVEETWDDIFEAADWTEPLYTETIGDAMENLREWFKQHYHTPKRKK